MQTCPYCAESIQDEAIKCRYCGEYLDDRQAPAKWYHSAPAVLIALLAVGPLGLPLVWTHPKYSIVTKIVITVAIIAVTVWFTMILWAQLARLSEILKEIQGFDP